MNKFKYYIVEAADPEDEKKVEKKIALKMKAKGYRYVILFPGSMNVSPLYVPDLKTANSLMRKEFKNVKDYKIATISKFVGSKKDFGSLVARYIQNLESIKK